MKKSKKIRQTASDFYSVLKSTYPFVKPYMKQSIVSIVLGEIAVVLSLFFPLLIKYLIDVVLIAGNTSNLYLFSVTLLFVILGKQLFAYFSNVIYAKFSETVCVNASLSLFSRLINKKISFFQKSDIGDLVQRTSTDSNNLHVFYSYYLQIIVESLLQIIVIFCILFLLHPLIALVSIFSVPIFIFLNFKISEKLKSKIKRVKEYSAKKTNFFFYAFRNILHIKNNVNECEFLDDISDVSHESLALQIETEKTGYWLSNLMNIISELNQLLTLIIGGILAASGRMTIGGLVAANSYLSYIYTPFINLSQAVAEMTRSIVGVERYMEYMNSCDEEVSETGIELKKIETIQLNNLSFGYSTNEAIIHELSFHIDKSDKIRVVGKSGSGKTTLSLLLKKLLEAPQNRILVNGIDINEYSNQSLRRKIFYLHQDIILYEGTVYNYLTKICPGVSEKDMNDALKDAQIYEELYSKERQGLNTLLINNAVDFSGGQRQRLRLASVFLQKADVVILDEPFTGLDEGTALSIWNKIKERLVNKTLIVSDHTLADVKYFNKTIDLS